MSVVLAEKVLDDRALQIALNRPGVRNAVNGQVAREMAAILDDLDADPSLRVGVIRGQGAWFSAGMDLKAFLEGDSPGFEDRGFGGFAQKPPKTFDRSYRRVRGGRRARSGVGMRSHRGRF